MKAKMLLLTFMSVVLAQSNAFAWSTEYKGHYNTSYDWWSGWQGGKEVWNCSAIINETPGKNEIAVRVKFEQENFSRDFSFEARNIVHPATDPNYIDVQDRYGSDYYTNDALNEIDGKTASLHYVRKSGKIAVTGVTLRGSPTGGNPDFRWNCFFK